MSGYETSVPGVPDGASPQAGWYPDPTGAPGERWWDGTAWTASTRTQAILSGPAAPMVYPVQVLKNTPSTAGLTLGIISMFIDPFAIPALLGIIFSAIGLNRANRLSQHGYGAVGRAKSVWGLVLSILGLLGTLLFKALLF